MPRAFVCGVYSRINSLGNNDNSRVVEQKQQDNRSKTELCKRNYIVHGTILELPCYTCIASATHRKSRHIIVDQELLKAMNLGYLHSWGAKKLPSSKITSLPSSLAYSISLLRPFSIHQIMFAVPVNGPLKGVPSAHPCA